jgi:hypothetical protein
MLIQHPKLKPQRDNQRIRVYRADAEFCEAYPELYEEEDGLEGIADHVNHITGFKRIQREFGTFINQSIILIEETGRFECAADSEGIMIGIHYEVDVPTILHELAHLIQFRKHPHGTYAHHDETFTTIYLRLIRIVLGKAEAVRMEALWDKHGVKFFR